MRATAILARRCGRLGHDLQVLRSSTRWAVAVALVLLARVAGAQPIVDTAAVAEALERGAILWDARDEIAYGRGHIPGAVNIGDVNRVLRNPQSEDFIPTADVARILGAAGIDPAREIVVYAARASTQAYFGLYAIRYFGGRNVRVYHDGVDGWREAGRSLATAATRRAPVALRLVPNETIAATTAEVVAKLKDPTVQILDVRTRAEFDGGDVRAIRGGHIPGAVNIPYEENWRDPDTASKLARRQVTENRGMSLKPEATLRSLYAGLDPAKETIVYCQSGVRAAETASVLEQLGFRNVRIFDSSWLGYAAKLDAPVANEVFFNVGAMNGRIAALQARLEALERALEEARKPK